MESKNYLMINTLTNVVDNIVYWNGNVNTWTPPENYLMLVDDETPAKIWVIKPNETEWTLDVEIGAGEIGFTWDGTYCITNQPQPEPLGNPV